MKRAGRGQGGGGRGGGRASSNLSTIYSTLSQIEKKQRVDSKTIKETWEDMNENQQDEIFTQHYRALEKNLEKDLTTMMDEDLQEENNDNELNNQSVRTIEDASIATMNTNNEEIGQFLTVQVSIKLSQEEIDEDIAYEDIARTSSKFIIQWTKKNLIKGVRHNKRNEVIDNICDFMSWVEDFRVVGRTQRYAQMYFQVFALAPWKSLIEDGRSIFRKYGLNVLLKWTIAKGWNRKIGMLAGPKTEVASLKEYEKELQEYSGIGISYFEIKKKVEKEGDVEARCIVVYAIEEKAEEMDLKLRKLVNDRTDTLTYFSFINGSPEQRKKALILNRLQNVKMKYEIIKKCHVKEKAKHKGVEKTFRKALSEVQISNETIFQAVEQGYGTRSDDIFVYYHPKHKRLVLKWFQDEFMKGIVLENSRQLETSVLKQTEEQKMYSQTVDQHLNKIIAMKQNTIQALPIYNSTVTYASVVKGTKTPNEENDNVSNMTDQSTEEKEKGKNPEMKHQEKQKARKTEEQSHDDQSSVWTKESVVQRINVLTDELKKERIEREKEKRERLKEREENRVIIQSIQQFQELLLNINDDDTDEEVGSQVKQIVRKLRKGVNKKSSNSDSDTDNRKNKI